MSHLLKTIAFILIVSGVPAQASQSAIQVEYSTPLSIQVSRTGSPACWVKWKIPEGSICVPKNVWLKSFSTQGVWKGHWTVSSPAENSNSERPISKNSGSNKRILRTFHVHSGNMLPAEQAHFRDFSHFPPIADLSIRLERRREAISEDLDQLSSFESFGILKHLLINESKPDDPAGLLRELGFIHVFSASGIHLAAIALLTGYGLLAVSSFLELPVGWGLCLSRTLTVILWFWGWALCGFRLSLLRPTLLFGLGRLAHTFGFRWKRGTPLFLAIAIDLTVSIYFLIAAHSPFSAFEWNQGRSFYLLAVGGGSLLSKSEKGHHWKLALGSWLLAAVWEGISLGHFSSFTPIFSLITIPLIALVIYPGLLLFSLLRPAAGSVLFHFIQSPLGFFDQIIKFLVKASFSTCNLWIIPSGYFWFSILGVSLVFGMPRKARTFTFLLLVLGCALFRVWPTKGVPQEQLVATQVEQLDVGQGDAALIRDSQNSAGLVDAGSQKTISDTSWIQIFSERGIEHMSWIGLTHLDEDHSGGVLRLARLMSIHCVATSAAELATERGKKYEAQLRDSGVLVKHHLADCVPYPALEPHPETKFKLHPIASANDNMCAFLVPLKGGGFYLSAGDATQKDEIRMGNWAVKEIHESPDPEPKFHRILKLSHHGSKTSSNPIFLETVSATEAWISVGVGNHYGHPSLSVLKQIENEKILLKRTDQSGVLRSNSIEK